MACGSCGGSKPQPKVKITSNYIARPKTKYSEMMLSIKVDKNETVRKNTKSNK